MDEPAQQKKPMSSFLRKQKSYKCHTGDVWIKSSTLKLKQYWVCVMGQELYCYKNKDADTHKAMHSLKGTFVKEEPKEKLDGKDYYPLKILFPPKKARTLYYQTEESRKTWVRFLQQAIGYQNMFDHYDFVKDLGKGQFGVVKLATHIQSGKKVAIKTVKKKKMSNTELELQRREIDVLKMCQHPSIIRLLDIFENPDYIYMVLEYMEGGDLYHYLLKRSFKIPEERARQIMHDMGAALFYLHSYGITHRDLKLENVMMSSNDDRGRPRLVDFGLSKILGPGETASETVGTMSYIAPEVLMAVPYDKSADIFSLGIIAYGCLAGQLPFDDDDDDEIKRMTIEDPLRFGPQWKKISPEAKDIVNKMLEKDPKKRASLEDFMSSKWITRGQEGLQRKRKDSTGVDKFLVFTQGE